MSVIESLQNAKIKRVVKLRNRRQRDKERVFIIEGYRELERATEVSFPIQEIYFCPELYLGENETKLIERVREASPEKVYVQEVSRQVFEKMAYRDRPEGLLAIARQPEWTLDSLAVRNPGENELYLVAVSIEKPGNLGTMLRCADACGAQGVIVCDRCTDLFNPNVVRASTGTLFTVPIAEGSSEEVMQWLKSRNVRVLSTSPDATSVYTEADLATSCALVLGSEQYGLDEYWLSQANELLQIPMEGRADSLNVAMATTVVMFEAMRQRRG